MAYEIDWFQYPHLIRVTFRGYLSLDDYAQSDQELLTLLQPMNAPVYVLMDMAAVASFPMSLYQVQVRLRAWRLPAYCGAVAYYTKPIMNVMIRSLNRLIGVPFLHARSLEAALSIVKYMEPELRPHLAHIQTQEMATLQLLEQQQHERFIIDMEAAEVRLSKYAADASPAPLRPRYLPMLRPPCALLVLPDPGLSLLDHLPTRVALPLCQPQREQVPV